MVLEWRLWRAVRLHCRDTYRTRLHGGAYLAKLETGNAETPPISPQNLDEYLASHLIDPALMRADDFNTFMEDRQAKLLRLIELATGQSVHHGGAAEDDDETDAETAEAK